MVNELVVILSGFMAMLKVVVTTLSNATLMALLIGLVEITVGGTISSVVKLQLYSAAKGMLPVLLTAVVIVAVYRVFDTKGRLGAKKASFPA